MSSPQKHIINQLSIELSVSSEQEAFGFRKTLEEMLQYEVGNLIDKFCSQYVSENEVLQIDHLEIDLGQIAGHNFKENWLETFKQTFEIQLFNSIQRQDFQSINPPKKLNNFELLTHFLLTGQLPWWVIQEDIILDNLIDEIILNQSFEFRDFLIQHKNDTHLIQRVIFQFSEQQIFGFLGNIQIYYKEYESFFEKINNKLKTHFSKLSLIQNQNKINIEIFFRVAAKHNFQAATDKQLISKCITLLAENSVIDLSEINVLILDLLSDFDVYSKKIEEQETIIFTEGIKKIKLQNAGIILISPFLKPFFQTLQLLENEKFISKNAQYKAIHLIKHLATGDTVFSEFDLTLEKLICGITLNESVPRKVVFTEQELFEANDLLESVIEHWKVLKNASVQALRTTFFQREGILQANDNGWQINIERKTQDLLLDSIPWGFSMIVNSWNNYIISVEW